MPEAPRYRQTFFRLLGFLRPYKASLAISTIFAIGYQGSQIALVWITKNVIDDALTPRDSHKLWMYVGAIVALGVVRAVLMFGRRLISGRQALAVEMDLRQSLYARLVRLSFGFYDRHQTGQLMSRATVDLQGVRFFLGYGLIFFFQNILTVVFVTGVLFFFEWKLALIELAVGGFVAFNLYLGLLVVPLRSLGMWIGQAQRATASGERIFQVMDEPEEIADRPDAGELPAGGGDLRFEGVGFEYMEGRPVLQDIDLELEPGQTIALIGHTGSGNTTLTSLGPRFYDVTSGRVTLDGVDVRDVKLNSLRHAIGVISQDPFLFSATVRENI